MINSEKLAPIMEGYKKYFSEHFKNERYKWEAIKHFQDNWDIEAEDFGAMFKKATEKAGNLLGSAHSYPRGMILEFAKADNEAVRQMFIKLYDESADLSERIERFISLSEQLRNRYNDGTWNHHYQNTNAISVYLWLRYPDKYYIYKYEIYRDTAKKLGSAYQPKRRYSPDNIVGGYAMYDEICSALQADKDIRGMLDNALTEKCYADTKLKTLTIDFGFYLCRFYHDEKSEKTEQLLLNDSMRKADNNPYRNSNADFLRFFSPLIEALRALGGRTARKQAHEKVIELMGISKEELSVTNKTGGSKIINKIDFARNYLVYEGLMGKETKGIWTLTELGKKIDMTLDLASRIFKKWVTIKLAKRKGNQIAETDLSQYYRFLPQYEKYTKEHFLSDVFMSEREYDKLTALLKRKKNIILQGAPGVGKTFCARRLAWSLMGEKNNDRICMVQFHQSYSYEDFIMGYRPTEDGGFGLQKGVFYSFCEQAKNHPNDDYYFIIDEINRGNLSKIFGEPLMLIESDKRGTDHQISLIYGNEPFYIPEKLHIIGMMNTADRSLAMIDYALRRRFSFYTMHPAFEKADENGFSDYAKKISCPLYHSVIETIIKLNKAIKEDSALGKGFEIGHSYFVSEKSEVIDDEWVKNVVEYEIIPLIEEYWFDNDSELEKWTKKLYQTIGEPYDK